MPQHCRVGFHIKGHHVGAEGRFPAEPLQHQLRHIPIDVRLTAAGDELLAQQRHGSAGSAPQFGEKLRPAAHRQPVEMQPRRQVAQGEIGRYRAAHRRLIQRVEAIEPGVQRRQRLGHGVRGGRARAGKDFLQRQRHDLHAEARRQRRFVQRAGLEAFRGFAHPSDASLAQQASQPPALRQDAHLLHGGEILRRRVHIRIRQPPSFEGESAQVDPA
ncbi:MAG: hypothetical protein BWY25_02091 [Chloroflexi bacterium ADurb.Bin222]|nr:MAG: hypothetical protein BWY25_02091 [Chloroflexi bacterium ADurb.Bin222]